MQSGSAESSGCQDARRQNTGWAVERGCRVCAVPPPRKHHARRSVTTAPVGSRGNQKSRTPPLKNREARKRATGWQCVATATSYPVTFLSNCPLKSKAPRAHRTLLRFGQAHRCNAGVRAATRPGYVLGITGLGCHFFRTGVTPTHELEWHITVGWAGFVARQVRPFLFAKTEDGALKTAEGRGTSGSTAYILQYVGRHDND